MSERTPLELLAEHPFTRDLSDAERQALLPLATLEHYEPDELLIQEGHPAAAFLLIVSGHVAIELFIPSRGVQRLQTVEPGSAVGWSWMLPAARWEFDARAMERTTAIRLEAAGLRELLAQDCCLERHLLRKLLLVVAERLKAARLQLLDLHGPPHRGVR